MHRTDGPEGTSFHHNGDFSGDVTIEPAGADYGVDIPFADLQYLVTVEKERRLTEALETVGFDEAGAWHGLSEYEEVELGLQVFAVEAGYAGCGSHQLALAVKLDIEHARELYTRLTELFAEK